jgi:DNA-binding response OmpR family regulator
MNFGNSQILIAEPDQDVNQTLKIYFETYGHTVRTLEQLGDVIRTARQWQPNAVLISSEFTDADPHQVCQQLLEDTLTSHIPIIMMLHLNDRRAKLKALEAGVDDIVIKPLDIEELRLRVEAAIRLATRRLSP